MIPFEQCPVCGGEVIVKEVEKVILDLLAAGLSANEILEELPDLEHNDIIAALNMSHF